MRRRSALKAMAAAALTVAGCQCIIKKEVPEIQLWKKPPVDVYWDDINKRWHYFEKIELSTKAGILSCSNGILFELKSEHSCLATRNNYNLFIPLAKEKHNKKYFFDSTHKNIIHYERDRECQGHFYEIVNTDFNTTNLLYM